MLQEAVEVHSRDELGVLVVWIPMLASDNEATARQAATMFADSRVKQFYDANRLGGVAYSRDLFHARFGDAIEALPAGHFLRAILAQGRDAKPEQMPMWDAALFYPAGVEWRDTAPRTDRWSKQLMFFGRARPDGVTGTFWVATLEQALVDSDWFTEIRRITAGLPGKKSPGQTAGQVPGVAPSSDALARPNGAAAPTAPVEVTSLAESLDSLKAHFNKAKGHHRFVALLSPT